MASATVGTNFSTTARTIGQAGHETQHGKRRDIPQGTPANSSAEIRAISVARYNPHDFGRPLPCSTARSTHCALVAPAPAPATTSDRWYGDGNGSRGRIVAFYCDTPEPNDLPIRAPPDGLPQFVGTSALGRFRRHICP